MKLLKNSKQVGGMQAFILAIVGVAVVLAVGLIVLTELQGSTVTTGTDGIINSTHYCAGAGGSWNTTDCTVGTATALPSAYTSTGSILTKLATVPTWIGIIIVVALAFIVLGYFYSKRG